ncbi:MAG: hypothetical protein QOD41_4593 [Cryptosporangiaceae bacterium]|nr:hypothetical protein [Cryptosporangiaceae bacterium]
MHPWIRPARVVLATSALALAGTLTAAQSPLGALAAAGGGAGAMPSPAAAHPSPSVSPAPSVPPSPSLSPSASASPSPAPTRNAARAARSAPRRVVPRWVLPMRGSLSSGFGVRWGVLHAGIDLANGSGGGSPVFAASAGTVTAARCTSPDCSHRGSLAMPGYGNMIDIAHAGGVTTRYGHLERMVVRPGQHVVAGSLIGFEGATGNVTGAHLHFEVHVGGSAINPLPFLRAHGLSPH